MPVMHDRVDRVEIHVSVHFQRGQKRSPRLEIYRLNSLRAKKEEKIFPMMRSELQCVLRVERKLHAYRDQRWRIAGTSSRLTTSPRSNWPWPMMRLACDSIPCEAKYMKSYSPTDGMLRRRRRVVVQRMDCLSWAAHVFASDLSEPLSFLLAASDSQASLSAARWASSSRIDDRFTGLTRWASKPASCACRRSSSCP